MAIVSTASAAFVAEWTPLVASLARRCGDLELAEDAAAEAFAEAARTWRAEPPDNPGAWLQTVAWRRLVDALRREERYATRVQLLAAAERAGPPMGSAEATAGLADDQLGLLFGCCHPALTTESRVALTLRAVHGLSTRQIAAAFLVSEDAMARRLGRARARLRELGGPFRIPPRPSWPERLDDVLRTIYVVFTAGHTATSSASLVRGDLCDEARWLAGLLTDLLPDDPEVRGLAALLALTDARRPARLDADGELVLLQDQDRSLWDLSLVAMGERLLSQALRQRRIGPFQLQAMVAATHARAVSWEATDWEAIEQTYGVLSTIDPSPVVALNRAVAVAMARGPAAGLALLDRLVVAGRLSDYHYLWAARADLLRRLDRREEAAGDYDRAIDLVTNEAERRFLQGRRAALV